MKKVLIIISLAALCLCGCGDKSSGPDTKPPKITSITPAIASVADTLEITFSENIDTSGLSIKKLEGDFQTAFSGANRILIYGTDSSSGINHFAFNSPVVFKLKNLTDLAGNVNSNLDALPINFYPWLDLDAFERSFDLGDTLRDAADG